MLLYCFSLYLRVISKYKPLGLYIQRHNLIEGFLFCTFEGLIIYWSCLYMEGLILGILL